MTSPTETEKMKVTSQTHSTTTQTGAANFIDLLFHEGKLTADQVQQIKFEAINTGNSLESIALQKDFITEEDLVKMKSKMYKIDFVDLFNINIPTEILNKISQELARKNGAVVFDANGDYVKIAMIDPLDLQKVKFLGALVGKQVKPYFATPTAIKQIIDTKYGAQVSEEVAEALEEVEDVISIKSTGHDLMTEISSAPVSRIVNMILEYAVKYKASDVHVEPHEAKLSIRFRLDGVMSEKLTLPKKLIPSVVSRIKILANLKIDEHRIPQDGRFQIKVDEKYIDIRVSVVPTIYGEKVVMRLLDKGGTVYPLEKTGMVGSGYKAYTEALSKTQGIILITGPTGSGKTQTLASSLQILNKPGINIMTLEDPVEIRIDGVNQMQVNPEIGLTFAEGLRSILRQDPDIIMVGEIRDVETAELAIQASLTGHLVLATLHTNSAAGALPRLLDMGVAPYLLASTINIIVGQRLVRTLNERCTEIYEAPKEVIAQLQKVLGTIPGFDIYKVAGSDDKVELFRPKETTECIDKSYSGRTGIFEVMIVTDTISQLVMAHKSANDIESQARREGMITMMQDGFMKALQGITTIEEVLRVQK